MKTKSIFELVGLIRADWAKPNYAALPYLNAMSTMNNINDVYGCDPGKEIVRYFLSNAGSWRGDVARAVKAELRSRL